MPRVAFVIAVSLTACKGRSSDVPSREHHDARRQYTEVDVASARYHSGDEIIEARDGARNALAVIRVARGEVGDDDLSAFPCGPSKHAHWYFLTIPVDGRDLLRAMPTQTRDCPRVLVRVLSVGAAGVSGARADGGWVISEDSERLIRAETLAILDVEARPRTPAPAGTQFATLDDIAIGPFRRGDLAEMALRAAPPLAGIEQSRVWMVPCSGDRHDLVFPDEQPDGELARSTECRLIRFSLRDRPAPGLAGQILEADVVKIGAPVRSSAQP